MSRIEFDAVVTGMNLPDQERTTVASLFDAYLAAFINQSAAMKARIDQIVEGDVDAWFEANRDWAIARLALETRLERDVSIAMTAEDHKQEWIKAMRGVRRRLLIHAYHEWQRQRHMIDIISALESVQLSNDERIRVAPIASAAEQQIDQHLRDLQEQSIDITFNMHDLAMKRQESGGHPTRSG